MSVFSVLVLFLDALSYYEKNESWIRKNWENATSLIQDRFKSVDSQPVNEQKCKVYCVKYKYVSALPQCDQNMRLARKILCYTTIPNVDIVCTESKCEID